MTITEFLLARIAEDEAVGRDWYHRSRFGGNKVSIYPEGTGYRRIVNPHRVLAECAAKRAILEDHAATDHSYREDVYVGDDVYLTPSLPACRQCTTSTDTARITSSWDVADRIVAPCDTVRALAAVYADHPDYDTEWSR